MKKILIIACMSSPLLTACEVVEENYYAPPQPYVETTRVEVYRPHVHRYQRPIIRREYSHDDAQVIVTNPPVYGHEDARVQVHGHDEAIPAETTRPNGGPQPMPRQGRVYGHR